MTLTKQDLQILNKLFRKIIKEELSNVLINPNSVNEATDILAPREVLISKNKQNLQKRFEGNPILQEFVQFVDDPSLPDSNDPNYVEEDGIPLDVINSMLKLGKNE